MAHRQSTEHPNIFLYPNGIFYFRGSFGGDQIERSLKTDDFRLAKKRAISIINSLDSDDFVSGGMTVDSEYPRYVEFKRDQLDDRKITKRYFKDITWYFEKYLQEHFGKVKLKDLANKKKGPEIWKKFKAKHRGRDMSNMRKIFRSFLFWCQTEGNLIWIMPCDIPSHEGREGIALTKEQSSALQLAASKDEKLLLFVFMYLLMAMRRGEITNLSWDQINFENASLLTKKYESKTKPARNIPIHPLVLKLLTERKSQSKSPFVFPNKLTPKRPMSVDGMKRSWAKALKTAKLDTLGVQMHDMRRTWATEAQVGGIGTDILREKFAGHSSKVAKESYVKAQTDQLRPMVNVVGVNKEVENTILNQNLARGNKGERE